MNSFREGKLFAPWGLRGSILQAYFSPKGMDRKGAFGRRAPVIRFWILKHIQQPHVEPIRRVARVSWQPLMYYRRTNCQTVMIIGLEYQMSWKRELPHVLFLSRIMQVVVPLDGFLRPENIVSLLEVGGAWHADGWRRFRRRAPCSLPPRMSSQLQSTRPRPKKVMNTTVHARQPDGIADTCCLIHPLSLFYCSSNGPVCLCCLTA